MIRKFIGFSALNSWAVSTSSVLATNSMLSSLTISPTITNMTTTYIGKDIIGQLFGFAYALKFGKNTDQQPLKYMTKGLVLQQAAIFLENSSCLVTNQNFILPLLGFSCILKNISFISIGAVSTSNLQKISSSNSLLNNPINSDNPVIQSNIGEMYSKLASINTLSSTLGMLSGLGFIYLIPSYTIRSAVVMPLLGIIAIFSMREATKIANNF